MQVRQDVALVQDIEKIDASLNEVLQQQGHDSCIAQIDGRGRHDSLARSGKAGMDIGSGGTPTQTILPFRSSKPSSGTISWTALTVSMMPFKLLACACR